MAVELSLEEGVNEAIRILETVNERPILVAVYGQPDSGKSYVIDGLGNYFDSKNLSVARRTGAPDIDDFERITRGESLDVQLFHCAWDSAEGGHAWDPFRKKYYSQDPVLLARDIEKTIHLTIGVYNPKFHRKPTGEYNLLISNPDSMRKERIT